MTTNPPTYNTTEHQLGSLAERVTAFFLRNPDDELSRGDIALKFEVPVNDVARLLKPLLDDKTLVLERSEGGGVLRSYSAGLALREAAKKQGKLDLGGATIAEPSKPKPEPKTKKRRGTQSVFLDGVDMDALKTGSGDPVNALTKFVKKKWQPIYDKVPNPGDWVEVPAEWHEALSSAVRKNNAYNKKTGAPARYLVRKVSATATRFWRLA
jgi:hypothetical protein